MRVDLTRIRPHSRESLSHFEKGPRCPNVTVPDALRCAKCNYRLWGLPFGGKCPECATSIRHSYAVHRKRLEGDATWTEFLAAYANFHLVIFIVIPSLSLAGLAVLGGSSLTLLSFPVALAFISAMLASISAWPFRIIRNRLTPFRCALLAIVGFAAATSCLFLSDRPFATTLIAVALTTLVVLLALALVPDRSE